MTNLSARFETILRSAPNLMAVLHKARDLDLPDWMIFSGAVYQPVWNHLTGRPIEYGISDYDLAYFDPDTSYEAEDAVIRRVAAAFDEPLKSLVETRNQARVHLWFENKFGEAYTQLKDSADAMTRFVCPAFCVGVRLEADDRLTIYAPLGLEDVFSMRLRPNPLRPLAKNWSRATTSAQTRWPEVRIEQP